MELITNAIVKTLEKYPLYKQDGKKFNSQTVILKYFLGGCTWLVMEAERQPNGDYLFYGLVNLGHGYEYGYFTLNELKSVKYKIGNLGYLRVERDLYFKPTLLKDIISKSELI